MLNLSQFGVAFGDNVILRSVDLSVPERGVFALLGPGGTGKSTLLRTICGINQAVSNLRTWGEVTYRGDPLGEAEYPVLVSQNMRLITSTVQENILNELPEKHELSKAQKQDLAIRLLKQSGLDELADCLDQRVVQLPIPVQRQLAIAREAAAGPGLLCVDEPTAELSTSEAERILDYLYKLGESSALLVVLHNQQEAKALADKTALLAGGWIQECNETEKFFIEPESKVTRNFILNGTCSVPSPDAKPEEIDAEADIPTPPPMPEAAREFVSDSFGPRGFLWLKQGLLAGTPWPGIVADEDHDLRALQRVGIKVLVSLTEEQFEPRKLKEYGIDALWLEIDDMKAPEYEEAYEMCQQVRKRMAEGKPVAYHCKAGLGRTGTLLAAQLIMEGKSALEALESVRKIEPRWVQSDEQVKFIEGFADYVNNGMKKTVSNEL
ncbi:phosphatase domain-containing putative toxin [Thiohalophilus thiocyanatoxydans]|uniref:phosphatase domain-containing putative toxin n=1 Tax=Thiohalophilus thiocyanatoxydans TaxID=381308 RepID=UPI00141709A8|nr:ATP-binding cassette domain-containing protein [Thiohalophilus thiocyanatoxydans]